MADYRDKSWWLETLPEDIHPNAALTQKEKADVAIIGGGYTGLSTAYHLKKFQPDMDVRLLESDICGYGASGRNGGFSMTLFGLTKGLPNSVLMMKRPDPPISIWKTRWIICMR